VEAGGDGGERAAAAGTAGGVRWSRWPWRTDVVSVQAPSRGLIR
jgi:hypothetical protein